MRVARARDLGSSSPRASSRAPISAISSVAPCPTTWAPDDLAVARLGEDLHEARGVRGGDRLARGRNGNLPTRRSSPYFARASSSVRPIHATCGCAVDAGRNLAVIERAGARCRRAARRPRCPPRSPCARAAAPPRGRRSRETRRRRWCASARPPRRSPSRRARRPPPRARGLARERAAADRHQHLVGLELLARVALRDRDAHAARSRSSTPRSACRADLDALAPELALQRPAATSVSAPGSIWSAISTTVTFAPYIA